MSTSSDFSGENLSFQVTGDGVAIDPATGILSIATAQLQSGVEVIVTAGNSGGNAASRFRLTIAAAPPEPLPGTPPVLLAAPALAGAALIGEALAVEPGTWGGDPAPALALQWRCDGADLPGATGPAFHPGATEDGKAVSCLVTASNAVGQLAAETAALPVAWPAPVATGTLSDVSYIQGSGPQTVEAAAAFAGAALAYVVAGGGASIDAGTGRVTLPTGALRAETVTVTASNSGGSASASFQVTVAAALLPPEVIGTLPDVGYFAGTGPQTVSAQAAFAGAELVYALAAAPAGVEIDTGSGLVTIPTAAALAATPVTVQASNAAGAALAGFMVTVRPTATSFDTAAKLAELSFLSDDTAPAWSLNASGGFGRLVPPLAGRVNGSWVHAAGDGLYRVLARWVATNQTTSGYSPFTFGARLGLSGVNWRGVYLEFFQPASGARRLRAQAFTGAGSSVSLIGTSAPGWEWNTWYWVELEIDGPSLRGRFYTETGTAPNWQIDATTAVLAAGAVGPAGLPRSGASPTVHIKRIEFQPLAGAAAPTAAKSGDWSLGQIPVQSGSVQP